MSWQDVAAGTAAQLLGLDADGLLIRATATGLSGGGASPVTSVNGHAGDVTLTKADLSLSNVDNTSDVNKPFTQSGTGAATRTVVGKLKEVVSVKDFGAAGDGATDDTTAIQNAVSYVGGIGGGTVYVPSGQYKITSPISVSHAFVTIAGTGTGSKIATSGNIDGFRFDHTAAIEHCTIRDLEIRNTVDSPLPTDGYGIRVLAPNCPYLNFINVTTRSKFGGVAFVPGGSSISGTNTVNAPTLINCIFRNTAGIGVYSSYVLDLALINVRIEMASTSSGVFGLYLSDWTQAVHGLNVIVLSGQYCLVVDGSTRHASELNFVNSVFDGAGADCVDLVATYRARFATCWFSTINSGASGIVLGAGAEQVDFEACHILNTGQYGLIASSGASNFRFCNGKIYNCSLQTANTYDAINIAAGVSNFEICGNRIFNSAEYTGTQRYGIVVNSGASDNYMIANNSLRGNATAGLSDAGTGTNKVVANNLI